MRSDRERILDILEAIDKIEKYAGQGRRAFEKDELIQVWVVHHLQVIGEAAGRLSEDFRSKMPHIPWAQIVAMRNILVHTYFSADLEEVWSAAENDLPELKKAFKEILDKMPRD